MFKARRLVYHSTLGSRVIQKKNGERFCVDLASSCSSRGERIFIELMTSDRKLQASREGSN